MMAFDTIVYLALFVGTILAHAYAEHVRVYRKMGGRLIKCPGPAGSSNHQRPGMRRREVVVTS